ncbi:surfactin synthase thioesterase subunit [Tumebacillus sp. BK434]|uniref:thioesterase II family protein n=1 Tax=Tumebacillus sp. BK434 TaxID=2512169 RepID=UPI00104FAB11|nr:alpha/beta fold hydrolase [Tumebacillus sp. BK434]TCP55912.1 surfactin synthase thioesterase subunit [Tumebacillus sp. BK434]
MTSIDLFCIPYAGGAAGAIYSKWSQFLDPSIQLRPLELAGHGRRMSEPFYPTMQAAVADMLSLVRAQLTDRPYAIYAHSMGTIIAYELTAALHAAGLPAPSVIFLSGRRPPHHPYENKNMHQMPDDVFLEEIWSMGGMSREVFASREWRQFFLPVLRNDYRIIETYQFQAPVQPSAADLVFFYSDQDDLVSKPGICEWERYTTGTFTCHDFSGGHFFLHDAGETICGLINQKLRTTGVLK